MATFETVTRVSPPVDNLGRIIAPLDLILEVADYGENVALERCDGPEGATCGLAHEMDGPRIVYGCKLATLCIGRTKAAYKGDSDVPGPVVAARAADTRFFELRTNPAFTSQAG